jgi:hypothetical protein
MKHLVDRFREGRMSVADFDALQDWLNSSHRAWFLTVLKFSDGASHASVVGF